MMLKEYLEAINYRITGGSEFQWQCFGNNARYLDCDDSLYAAGTYSVNAVFDCETQMVYSVEAWDYVNDRTYRWIDPDYIQAYKKACKKHDVDFKNAMDDKNYIDIDVEKDILSKAGAIVAGEEYDTRVQIEVDIPDEDLLQYMKLAHDLDITFNELVERAVKAAIDEAERDPTAFKERAKRFINEN